jgi:hypothetical protein
LRAQGIESVTHIGGTARQIHAHTCRRPDHLASSAVSTQRKARSSTSASTRATIPFGHLLSIWLHERAAPGLAETATALSELRLDRSGVRHDLHLRAPCFCHVYRRPILISYRRASALTIAFGDSFTHDAQFVFPSPPARRLNANANVHALIESERNGVSFRPS